VRAYGHRRTSSPAVPISDSSPHVSAATASLELKIPYDDCPNIQHARGGSAQSIQNQASTGTSTLPPPRISPETSPSILEALRNHGIGDSRAGIIRRRIFQARPVVGLPLIDILIHRAPARLRAGTSSQGCEDDLQSPPFWQYPAKHFSSASGFFNNRHHLIHFRASWKLPVRPQT
jgi:hypothetical protein